MSVLRRLIYREVFTAVTTVTVAFIGLFFFFDFIFDSALDIWACCCDAYAFCKFFKKPR